MVKQLYDNYWLLHYYLAHILSPLKIAVSRRPYSLAVVKAGLGLTLTISWSHSVKNG